MLKKKIGKFSISDLKELIFSKLGVSNKKVIQGPQSGQDTNIVSLSDDFRLLVTTDPLYVNMNFPAEQAAWFGFHIILSDMLMSGVYPQYAIFSLNLPNDIDSGIFTRIWNVLHSECKRLGIAIISGHTGSYDGCNFPILGSGTFLAITPPERCMNLKVAKIGDHIILVRLPGVETIASLLMIDKREGESLFKDNYEAMKAKYWSQLSLEVPVDAILEFQSKKIEKPVLGMHDIAERGLLGALNEVAQLTGFGLLVNFDEIKIPEKLTDFIQHYFDTIEPIFSASGQGGLILVCKERYTKDLIEALRMQSIEAFNIGKFTHPDQGKTFIYKDKEHPIEDDIEDPFWPVFTNIKK